MAARSYTGSSLMKRSWRWWWAASVLTHLTLISAVATVSHRTSRPAAAPRAAVDIEFVCDPPSAREEGPRPHAGDLTTPVRAGGARSAQNISSDRAGGGGDGQSLEQGRLLAARAEAVTLDTRLINTLQTSQEQRIRTARDRASPQDDRRTPNPRDDDQLATGHGEILFRLPDARAMPTQGAVQPAGALEQAGQPITARAEPTSDDGRTAVALPTPVGEVPHVRAGIAHATTGDAPRVAGPVRTGRPSLDTGHASTTADERATRPDDDRDATLLATSMLTAYVTASVQDGPRRAQGEGGIGGGGEAGSGRDVGRGGHARALGDGEGWLSLDSDDDRFVRYFHEVRRRLHGLWANAFPHDEALQQHSGLVILQFVIARDGSVHDVVVARRSGIERFDRNVTDAVRGAHLPPIPAALARSELRVRAPFDFRNPVVR